VEIQKRQLNNQEKQNQKNKCLPLKRSKEIAVTSPEEVKTREDEKLLLEELYKDSLEYFESS